MKPYPIILFSLFILFFFTRVSFSQTASEPASVFIIEGVVKFNKKPVGNATLTLYKNGKQIAQQITPKSGLYRFELTKSNNNPQNIYKIDVSKQSLNTALLAVNTYIPAEQYSPLPYLFNYDFSLTAIEAIQNGKRKDFGRVKWDTDKKIFAFDGNYVSTLELEEKTNDSLKTAVSKAELLNKQLEKKQADSLMATIFNKTSTTTKTLNTEEPNKKSKDSTTIALNKTNSSLEQTNSSKSNKEKTDINTKSKNNETSNKANKSNDTNIAIKPSNKTSEKSTLLSNTVNNKTNKTLEKNNTTETTNLSTLNQANILNNSSTAQNNNNPNINGKVLKNTADTNLVKGNTDNASPKDLFFLTGVPMEQFKRNLSTTYTSKNEGTYDEKEQMFANSERSRLLQEKLKMQKIKSENFAKKHETNNTLTSLLDEVVEFEKSNRHQNNVNKK